MVEGKSRMGRQGLKQRRLRGRVEVAIEMARRFSLLVWKHFFVWKRRDFPDIV